MALFRYPSKAVMSFLAGLGGLFLNITASAAAITVNGAGSLYMTGTTARAVTLGTCEKGDMRLVYAVGETASGAFDVAPDTDPAVTCKQLDGTTAMAGAALADAGDWVLFAATGTNAWRVVLHNGATFS